MLTGRGNVAVQPGRVIVTNQTKSNGEQSIALERFRVTGSLLAPQKMKESNRPGAPARHDTVRSKR